MGPFFPNSLFRRLLVLLGGFLGVLGALGCLRGVRGFRGLNPKPKTLNPKPQGLLGLRGL